MVKKKQIKVLQVPAKDSVIGSHIDAIEQEEWYQALTGEVRDILVETESNARWDLIDGRHKVGTRILEEYNVHKKEFKNKEELVQRVAVSIGRSERSIWYAVQIAQKWPLLEDSPITKDMSLRRVCLELLPAPKENLIERPIPKGEYGLVVIDPPWPYGTEYDADSRRVASPYKELGLDELARLKIPAANNSVIWLWTTHKFLMPSFDLLKGWGFEYKLTMAWDKQRLGMGEWLRCQMEFCLLGIKGKPKWNLKNERDLISEKRREHSRKPDGFYKMVERLTPVKEKIDMFGREKRNGWTIWGETPDKF